MLNNEERNFKEENEEKEKLLEQPKDHLAAELISYKRRFNNLKEEKEDLEDSLEDLREYIVDNEISQNTQSYDETAQDESESVTKEGLSLEVEKNLISNFALFLAIFGFSATLVISSQIGLVLALPGAMTTVFTAYAWRHFRKA